MKNNPAKIPKRIVIHTRDVENITGLRPRTAQKLLQNIRQRFGKPEEAFITIGEFSIYTGIKEDQLREFL